MKKSLVATERRRANVRQRRRDWFAHRLPAIARTPEHVVFLDETAVKTNLVRLRGWACTVSDALATHNGHVSVRLLLFLR